MRGRIAASVLLIGFVLTASIGGVPTVTASASATAAHSPDRNASDDASGPLGRSYGFENEAPGAGAPDRFETVTDAQGRGQTRVGLDEVDDAVAYEGTQSYHGVENRTGNALYLRPAAQPFDAPQTANVSVALRRPANFRDAGVSGKAALGLYERTDTAPNVRLHLKHDALRVKATGDVLTRTTPDEWVHVTVFDVDPRTDTYAVAWETPDDSGVETGLPMNEPMEEGYRSTVLSVDEEGYADALRIGDASDAESDEDSDEDAEVSQSTDEGLLDSPLVLGGFGLAGLFLAVLVVLLVAGDW